MVIKGGTTIATPEKVVKNSVNLGENEQSIPIKTNI